MLSECTASTSTKDDADRSDRAPKCAPAAGKVELSSIVRVPPAWIAGTRRQRRVGGSAALPARSDARRRRVERVERRGRCVRPHRVEDGGFGPRGILGSSRRQQHRRNRACLEGAIGVGPTAVRGGGVGYLMGPLMRRTRRHGRVLVVRRRSRRDRILGDTRRHASQQAELQERQARHDRDNSP